MAGRRREWLGRGSEHAHSERMPGRGSATTAMPTWLYLAHTIPGLLPELRPSFRALPSAIRLRLWASVARGFRKTCHCGVRHFSTQL